MTTEKRKHLAAWFSIIFIFVTLASLFYIVKEENHKCTGEDCPVCACVEGADKILDYYRASKGAFLCIQKNKRILHYGYIIKQSL